MANDSSSLNSLREIHKDDNSLDLKRYISLFLSNWYWFAFTVLFALTLAYGINRYSARVYTVSSSLLIEDYQYGGGNSGIETIFPGTGAFKTEQNLKNEIGILKSFYLNKKVMDEMPDFHVEYVGIGRRGIAETVLYNDCPFKVILDSITNLNSGEIYLKVISRNEFELKINDKSIEGGPFHYGQKVEINEFKFRIFPRNTDKGIFEIGNPKQYYFSFKSSENLANAYRSRLSVTPIQENSTLVTLTITGFVKDQQVDYLNKLMRTYINQGLEFKNQTADSTVLFINQQLDLIAKSLDSAGHELENFRRNNQIIDLSKEGTLFQNKLEDYGNEKVNLLLQQRYYNYLLSYIISKNESGDIISPSLMGVTNETVVKLVGDLETQQQLKLKLKLNISKDLPAVELVDKSINSIKSLVSENAESSLKILGTMIVDVNQRINLVENEIGNLPLKEGELINIQRKFDLNNTIYTFLLEKKAEAQIAKASTVSDNRIIDDAYSYNSFTIKPKTRQNYIIALIFGLLFPVIAIYLIDFFNNKIIDKNDIERGTSAPVIGFISHSDTKNEMPVAEKPGSTLAESFRAIRTNLKYFFKDTQNPVIAVSSTISSEGKTFISVNLASVLALLGKKVLLVGLDLRKPRIHNIFNLDNEVGLSTFLSGQNVFEDIIHKTKVENLFYAQSGPVPPNPAELIESSLMTVFIENAKKEFDYIIIDTPPVAVVSDALLISHLADFYLFVVRQRYTSKNTLELIEEFYRNENIKKLGIIINDISLSGYYGYGLRYGYSLGYGYTYGYNYYGTYSYGKYGYHYKGDSYYTND
jgi:tyrosine-protein kinase Etk/Wzc